MLTRAHIGASVEGYVATSDGMPAVPASLHPVAGAGSLARYGPGRPSSRAIKVLQVDEWLHEREPVVDLASTLLCAWRGDLGQLRIPLPDECLDLFWVDDGSLWLHGPETRSWLPGPAQRLTAVGVRFQPGAGPSALGLAASEVCDTAGYYDQQHLTHDVRAIFGTTPTTLLRVSGVRSIQDLPGGSRG